MAPSGGVLSCAPGGGLPRGGDCHEVGLPSGGVAWHKLCILCSLFALWFPCVCPFFCCPVFSIFVSVFLFVCVVFFQVVHVLASMDQCFSVFFVVVCFLFFCCLCFVSFSLFSLFFVQRRVRRGFKIS